MEGVRVPVLAGSRVLLATFPSQTQLLVPPPPLDALSDIGAAVAEAMRYPLSGRPLAALATRAGRVTVVVEPPLLPLPGTIEDPRRDALARVLDELTKAGIPAERQTLLVAGGLERRAGRDQLDWLLPPARARDFRGSLIVHDCEAEDLVRLDTDTEIAVRINPALIETDLVVTVTAAETVLHGGPAALLGACSVGALRATGAESLLEPHTSRGWALACAIESALARHVPVLGVSVLLDLPQAARPYTGYPRDAETRTSAASSVFRRLLNTAPEAVRRAALQKGAQELSTIAVMSGPPSVAHAEALLRGISLRAATLGEPLDTIVVPVPWKDAHHPREAPNPVTAAAIGLGLALRLWRDRSPLVEGGTIILLHPFSRTIGHGPQAPYRALLAALRDGPAGARVREAEAVASRDRRALAAYRAGRAPHPRLPFADWDACAPARKRAGRVIVAGCRDASAARSLGFVPSHNLATAVEMALGVSDGDRFGVLLAPPYVPLSPAPGTPSEPARSS
jgi:Lactate racemase N-terminal domain